MNRLFILCDADGQYVMADGSMTTELKKAEVFTIGRATFLMKMRPLFAINLYPQTVHSTQLSVMK